TWRPPPRRNPPGMAGHLIWALQNGHAGSGDVRYRPANWELLRGRPTDTKLVAWAVRELPGNDLRCEGRLFGAGLLLGGLWPVSGGSGGWGGLGSGRLPGIARCADANPIKRLVLDYRSVQVLLAAQVAIWCELLRGRDDLAVGLVEGLCF